MQPTVLGLSILTVLPFVSAHGFLRSITIDGAVNKGNVPNGDAADSAIRLIDDVSPVKGTSNVALNCGQNAKAASLVADANPGSKLTFDWAGGDGGNWPHNTGPMITYLASCGNTTCDKYDPLNAEWFKIDEVGKKDGTSTWVQQDLMNGGTYSTSLPKDLAAGQYLIRHEIIALHLATEEGGVEFYPSCTQIKVGGNQTGTPSSSDLVIFPGAYSDNDPGILVNAFNDNKYDFPGPELADLSDDSTNGPSSESVSSASPSSVAPSQTGSSPDTSSIASASTAESTSTRMHKHKQCGSSLASVSASASAFTTTTASVTGVSSVESIITSFAVTSTITLDSISLPSADVRDVRPRRISRIMLNL